MDRYGNAIYLTPMVLGGLASVFAAAWRFLGVRPAETAQASLDVLCGLPGRVRNSDREAELRAIEDEVDAILRVELQKSADSDNAIEASALIAAAQRIDNLIHHRRTLLAADTSAVKTMECGLAPIFDDAAPRA